MFTQSRNLHNLKIAMRILRIRKLRANLEIAHWGYAILRSRNFCCGPRSSFQFPLCIKVKSIHKELLQLRRHHQRCVCTQAPHTRNFWEVPPFKASLSRKALNSLLLASSDALTTLICYIRKLHSHNLKIGMQFPGSENAQRNLEIAQISRLGGMYTCIID